MSPITLFVTLVLVNFILRLKIRSTSSSWLLKLIFTLGVPLHEAAHYIFAKVLLLKVTKTQFLPNFKDKNKMGFVQFIPHTGLLGALTNMLVGIAPLLLGFAILFILYNQEKSTDTNALSYLGIGLTTVVVMQSMIPSWQDIKIALKGLCITLALLVVTSLAFPVRWENIISYELSALLEVVSPHLMVLTLYQVTAVLVLTALKTRN
mgnify:FL=1